MTSANKLPSETSGTKASVPAAPAGPGSVGRWRAWLGVAPAELELLRPVRPVAPVAGVLLAAGLLAAGAAAVGLQPAFERKAALSAEQALLERRLERLGVRPVATVDSRHGGRRETLEEGRELAAQLRRPWHQLFDQLEEAAQADGGAVHVVQLTVDPRFDTLQLVAEARDLGHLVRFSQRLTGGAPVHNLVLTHYEWRDALGGHVLSAALQGELAPVASTPAPPVALSLASAPVLR
jgi:hypothetical protein